MIYKIKEPNLCDFCNAEKETIQHLFCECNISTTIWWEVLNWLNSQGFYFEFVTDVQIILGDPKLDPAINRIILTDKIAIFKNK